MNCKPSICDNSGKYSMTKMSMLKNFRLIVLMWLIIYILVFKSINFWLSSCILFLFFMFIIILITYSFKSFPFTHISKAKYYLRRRSWVIANAEGDNRFILFQKSHGQEHSWSSVQRGTAGKIWYDTFSIRGGVRLIPLV